MIERARLTGLYAELEVADMTQGLHGKPEASVDLVLAADAMVYVSDLAPLLREVTRVLVSGGLLAFTVETHAGEGVLIGEGLRYAHAAPYVRAQVAAAGLKLAHCENLSARNEDNVPAPGPGRGGHKNLSLDAMRFLQWPWYYTDRQIPACRSPGNVGQYVP